MRGTSTYANWNVVPAGVEVAPKLKLGGVLTLKPTVGNELFVSGVDCVIKGENPGAARFLSWNKRFVAEFTLVLNKYL